MRRRSSEAAWEILTRWILIVPVSERLVLLALQDPNGRSSSPPA